MALDKRQQMVDQRRRQVGCYWKQRTTGSYDDEIRRRRPEQRLAPMGGAAQERRCRKPVICKGFVKVCVRYDMYFLREFDIVLRENIASTQVSWGR